VSFPYPLAGGARVDYPYATLNPGALPPAPAAWAVGPATRAGPQPFAGGRM